MMPYGRAVVLALAVAAQGVAAQSGGCAPGFGTTCTGGTCTACSECAAGTYGLGGNYSCATCPTGSISASPGSGACNCKVGFFFDDVAADFAGVPRNLWATRSCTDCTNLLSVKQRATTFECPGGPGIVNTNFTSTRRLQTSVPTVPEGPIVALAGWYLENKRCRKKKDGSTHVCFTVHACGDNMCYGLPDTIRKEVNDMPEKTVAAALNDNTEYCKTLHAIALSEGATENDLITTFEYENKTEYEGFFYEEEATCKERYIAQLYEQRKHNGYGLQNYCYPGHDTTSRACSECTGDLKKGDDGLCHACDEHSLWTTVSGDVYTIFAYQIPYTLFMKSGKPQALKSAMFASFMFFIQTVTLLGKDSGYFMGDALDDEAKADYTSNVDYYSRFLSANMKTSDEILVVNKTIEPTEVCPLDLDRHEIFFKNAVLKSIGLIFGVVVWHHFLFTVLVHTRLHYYLLVWQKNTHRNWTMEVKATWQTPTYDDEGIAPPSFCRKLVNAITFGVFCPIEHGEKKMMPSHEKACFGPSAVMLDFHTCHILLDTARAMQAGKDQVSRVRARGHFLQVDKDGSKSLDKEEMMELLKDMGQRPTIDDIDEIFDNYGSDDEMSEEQFVSWWMDRRQAARELMIKRAHSCAASCDKANLSTFRPQGACRAEAVLSCAEVHRKGGSDDTIHVHPDLKELLAAAHITELWRNTWMSTLTMGCLTPSVGWKNANYGGATNKTWAQIKALLAKRELPSNWFTGDDSTSDLEAFRNKLAEVTLTPAERVRINAVYPIAQQEIIVNFDILPEGCTNDSREVTRPQARGQENPKKLMSKKDYNQHNVIAGLEVRKRLDAAFVKDVMIRNGVAGTSLDQELVVDMKDANPKARFWRAMMMLATTVLYYPVIQDTLPIVHCTAYMTDRYYDRTGGPDKTGAMEEADLIDDADIKEGKFNYLQSDRSVVCDGDRHFYASWVAYGILGLCIVGPYLAYRLIKQGKHAAYLLAVAEDQAKGLKVAKKIKKGFLASIFLGEHRPPTRRETALFEERIMRDPMSGLYAMCEQRAYYWFVVDLMRKGVVTAIYTFGRNSFDWQFVMLCFFVFFAINQDIAQPYRGRTENIFSFMTLMFIIVLIHTSTNTDSTSLLPLVMMVVVVGCTFIVFIIGVYFTKKAEREDAAEADRVKRKARGLWGYVAKELLLLNPESSSDANMKQAFRVFDDADTEGTGKKLRETISRMSNADDSITESPKGADYDSDTDSVYEEGGGDGRITRGELMALRDNDRRISGFKIPYLEINPETKEDLGFQKIFSVSEDDIDDMIDEADTEGTGSVVYEEFVAAVFNSWEQTQQTQMLCDWLFCEYERVDLSDYHGGMSNKKMLMKFDAYVPLVKKTCCSHAKSKTDGKLAGIHQRYMNRGDNISNSPLVEDFASFCGMLESISEREIILADGLAPGFTVDLGELQGLVGLRVRSEPLKDNQRMTSAFDSKANAMALKERAQTLVEMAQESPAKTEPAPTESPAKTEPEPEPEAEPELEPEPEAEAEAEAEELESEAVPESNP